MNPNLRQLKNMHPALTCCFNQEYINHRKKETIKIPVTFKLEGVFLFCPSLFSPLTSFFFFSLFLCHPTSCQLMRTCRWLVMNSDEHMGQICMYVCVCVCKQRVVNGRPATFFTLCPSLTLLHPSGRRHPDSVNNADSNRLFAEARPRLWGDEAR